MAVIISLEDYEALEAWEDQMDLKAAKKADAEIKKSGTVSWERTKKELGL